MWISPLIGEGLILRSLAVEKRHVVYVKGVFEASEGVGAVFAMPRALRAPGAKLGGALTIVAPASREAEVDQLLVDLKAELGDAVTLDAITGLFRSAS